MTSERENWSTKYWDIMDNMYWSPQYTSMKSIPRKSWVVSDDFVCLPREAVNMEAQLYTRQRKDSDHHTWLQRQEETLNHMFDITFAIAPDAVIDTCFAEPLGLNCTGPFTSLGRETRFRYGWGRYANVTQHDGLFLTPDCVLAVELKLNSRSSPVQILKYAALMAWEESVSGPREYLGLLYIVPAAKITGHWKACRLDGPVIDEAFFDVHFKQIKAEVVRDFMSDNEMAIRSVLNRMKLGVISWEEHRSTCSDICAGLDETRGGDQCLVRLLDGWIASVSGHLDPKGDPTEPPEPD